MHARVASAPGRLRPRARWRTGHTVAAVALAAILLRLVLFLGRGDYVAFDEGWYLLLGRNLWAGDGFTLSGLRHVALSPLFPILAGALDLLVGSPVWAGRIVAAVAAGLLVVPAWAVFRRLAGRRTALLACALVATLPSLAPFVVPYWIGWDLWVGAEPLLHLFLFSGIALTLRALDRRSTLDWALAGAAFGLAYLARPEAVVAASAVGLAALVLAARDRGKTLARPVLFGLAFALVALPYWLYLHDALGRWTLTGRDVAVSTPALKRKAAETARSHGASGPVERMLWQDDEESYTRVLYALDPSGTRLANGYWGIAPQQEDRPAGSAESRTAPPPDDRSAVRLPAPGGAADDHPRAAAAAGPIATATGRGEASPRTAGSPPESAAPGRLTLYARALGVVVPWFVWPFIVIGAAGCAGLRRGRELLFVLPLAAMSVAAASLVAIDPRTQLSLAPALALYAARGIRLSGILAARRGRSSGVRRGFAVRLFAAVCLTLLLGISARRLYMSLGVGSPHHIVAAANARVGQELRRIVPAGRPVMSWHPAIALYAGRDWRVLPFAPLEQVVRYAVANDVEHVVLSGFYPPDWAIDRIPGEYMILRVTPEAGQGGQWQVQTTRLAEGITLADLRAAGVGVPPAQRRATTPEAG